MRPAALIFDVDGTLAETEELHRAAFNDAFAAAGLGWEWTQGIYRRLLKVTGGKERIAVWCGERGVALSPAEIAALHADKTARYVAMMAAGRIALRPGVARIMAEARARSVALAIATTTSRANVEALTRAVWGATGAEMFDVIAAGDEVAAKKPAPDVYRLALERLALPPSAALAFEDSRNGLLAAREAGLRTIVTPSIYTAGEDFTGALSVLPDLAGYSPFATGKAAAMG
ncbi:MAG: HAD-IA family hydrolase [Proteobacteria bacterium]|nr:HAD-IA family hydrolase [Pseudomonadota bacterium]